MLENHSNRQDYRSIVDGISQYAVEPSELVARSYYNGYGGPATYYPAFDPLSILASLAFLAFLLQSFASLFERSRSILPATVAARESSELETSEIVMRVLDALEKRERRSGRSNRNVK